MRPNGFGKNNKQIDIVYKQQTKYLVENHRDIKTCQ